MNQPTKPTCIALSTFALIFTLHNPHHYSLFQIRQHHANYKPTLPLQSQLPFGNHNSYSHMGSVSSEDASDEPCGSYSLSADVSESESECSFSRRPFDTGGAASSSIPSTPPKTANFTFPATAQPPAFTFPPLVSGKAVLVSDEKPEKREVDLSG